MFIDPIYLFCCMLETMTQHTWLEKTRIFPFLLRIIKRVVIFPPFRHLLRWIAIILTPPLKAANWLFEVIDRYLGLSTKMLPSFFLYLSDGVYKKQIARTQIRYADKGGE